MYEYCYEHSHINQSIYMFSFILSTYLLVELLCRMVKFMFSFLRNYNTVLQSGSPILCSYQRSVRVHFSISSPALGRVSLFDYSHSSKCVVLSHFGFNLYFPRDYLMVSVFSCV